MEELKQAALCTLLEELTTLFDEDSGAEEYAEARCNAEQCIRILHEIGMPEQAVLPKDGIVTLGMNNVERFVAHNFRMASDDARSKILDILKKRAFFENI